MRVSVPAVFNIANAGQAMPSLKVEGSTFTVDGIVPGLYRAVGTLQGIRAPIGPWWLKSLVVSGRDVLDAPLDLRQSADDAVATFADTASELSGAVKDAQGNAAADHFVVVSSTDRVHVVLQLAQSRGRAHRTRRAATRSATCRPANTASPPPSISIPASGSTRPSSSACCRPPRHSRSPALSEEQWT